MNEKVIFFRSSRIPSHKLAQSTRSRSPFFALAKKVNKIAFGKNKVGLQHTTKQGTCALTSSRSKTLICCSTAFSPSKVEN
tara:strand:+ start:361 stop:603 length:243 start_codon:yes stop_codon:yes gene_type:complete